MTQVLSKNLDQRIVIPGTWEHFKLIQKGFEEAPGARLAYYKGTIEIIMPGENHEYFSHIVGYLLTTFLLGLGIEFKPTGAKDQEKPGEVSAQADQSYCLGNFKPIPDLSIEVVFTSGGEKKLARYRALGVPEVWFWQDGVLKLHHLRENEYQRISRSELPGLDQLDINLLQRCILIAETDFAQAVRVFQELI
ncbi:Uma2 family endonuclease [Leptolyngbya sp. NIES-2104]|uniref:Uma2 family endonuclease n=1 Tax=Leptolyngbya sp. NIES-2104 TaxID=1552121 RepID=UPI0006EC90F0|nr:Uma2 family endonuclease [Leptolyngbya sp. NIES-2104]GAP95628.1 slr1315 protein [Leptolyngbya sp. NIES-2104]